ncbi:MAG: hypothetical protein J5663_10550 [Bacteroidaceae bacterium]|nr:hypothetical protein [Bacteroidaceae bacterium]
MEFVEIIIVLLLFCLQIYFCQQVFARTREIATFLPNVRNIKIKKEYIVEKKDVTPSTGTTDDEVESVTEIVYDEKKYNSLLCITDSNNKLLDEMVKAINGYLRKNKGNAADFHLIKDIVDRHVDTVDEEINHMLPVPLYLGLAATMIGIIFGLLSLDGDVDSASFVQSIGKLIDSIKYAMTCSLVGLLMTTFLSSWRYRKAKATLERQKNTLLNFIQMELLPHLNEDAVSTLLNMQANLQLFNERFRSNICGFSSIMDNIHRAFDSQVRLVEDLKKMDIAQVAQFNKDVLVQLHSSMAEFQKFTQYLHQMNSFVSATTELTNSVNSQLDRTNAVEKVIFTLRDNIDKNQSVMDMLASFLEKVDANEAILTASNTLDKAVAESMDNMKSHVNAQVEELKTYTIKATAELESLMQREKGQLDRLKNLEKLDTIVRSIQAMSTDNKVVTEALAKRIANLTNAIDGIGRGTTSSGVPAIVTWIVCILVSIASIMFIINLFDPFYKPVPEQMAPSEKQYNDTLYSDIDSMGINSL